MVYVGKIHSTRMSIDRLLSKPKQLNASGMSKPYLPIPLVFLSLMFRLYKEVKNNLTITRTQQFSDAMTVSKDLMANLLLAAGGRGGISTGGGGSNSELTNWDGTRKKTGWGM